MIHFPEPLLKGDLIRLISPAGPIDADDISSGIATLKGWGYRVDLGANIYSKQNYTAGSDEERLDDLIGALSDQNVKGIICTRGGYGAARLLDKFPWSKFEDTPPKIFVGFSDIGALMLSFWSKYRWVSFFGPQVANGLNGNSTQRSISHFRQMIGSENREIGWEGNDTVWLKAIINGSCRGYLVPCCLSILVSLIGTNFSPDLRDSILCIEDLSEPLYKYDRMLTQLRLSGVLDNINGLILGRFIYKGEDISDRVACVAADVFQSLSIPIWGNMPYGHVEDRLTLPIGIRVQVSDTGGLATLKDQQER